MQDYSSQGQTFALFDIRAGYTFTPGDTELLTFGEIINLLALKNPCCVEYTVVDKRIPAGAPKTAGGGVE